MIERLKETVEKENKTKKSKEEKESEKGESVDVIGSFGEKEIQLEKEEREKEEEVSFCVEQSDKKVVLHSNSDEEACLINSDLNHSFSSVSLSQKIEDESPKEVFSGLPSVKIQDHQFDSFSTVQSIRLVIAHGERVLFAMLSTK